MSNSKKRGKSFLNLAKSRKTTYEFTDRAVKDDSLNKILEAGRWAPSSHNSQPWSFVIVKDKKTIDKLMRICYYGAFHDNPPIIIAIILEPIYISQKALLRGNVKTFADTHKYINIGFPVLNMVYEATSLGISSFIVSPIVKEANKIIKVPKGREVILLLGLGYEKKGAYQKERRRKELKDFISYEYYGRKK